MKSGAKLITEKRERHPKKGFDYNHDSEHEVVDFLDAAYAYMYKKEAAWPFSDGFKLGNDIENLVNAGSMIAAAIDRLNRYEVGKTYRVSLPNQSGTFRISDIKILKSGTLLFYFNGIDGDLRTDRQSFMLGSKFDENSEPFITQQ